MCIIPLPSAAQASNLVKWSSHYAVFVCVEVAEKNRRDSDGSPRVRASCREFAWDSVGSERIELRFYFSEVVGAIFGDSKKSDSMLSDFANTPRTRVKLNSEGNSYPVRI